MDPSNLKIFFENEDFIIVDKPEGIEFHGDDGLLRLLRGNYDVFGVHRLDKGTSGLMVFAKNKQIQSELSQTFEKREVIKYYWALSSKKPLKKMGKIKGDLEKGRAGSYYLKKTQENPSITNFISSFIEKEKKRLFILRPLTGKTHQLRVVLKAIGSPILGDARYKGENSDRMYLDAFYLKFKLKDIEYCFKRIPDQKKYEDLNKHLLSLWQNEHADKIFEDQTRLLDLD